jgi:hypothetical protein
MTWLPSHNNRQMQDKTSLLATSSETGPKINLKKTELMKINTTVQLTITVGGEPIKEVDSFIYLGSVVDRQGGTDHDIKSRIGQARVAFTQSLSRVIVYLCQRRKISKSIPLVNRLFRG